MELDKNIIRILQKKRGCYLSGEELAGHLGISRAAVWKRIKRLKTMHGYSIESKASQGYRLSEDYMPFDGLSLNAVAESSFSEGRIFFYPNLTSTNDTAYKMAIDGCPEGTAVVADCQSGGRGRLGRKWISPSGVNIYISIVLRPPLTPLEAPRITLVSALSVVETIKEISPGIVPKIKWPNDVLLNGRKVSGILTEMNSEMDRINFIIVGAGINVNMTGDMFPEELRYAATSLKEETGGIIDRAKVIKVFLGKFEDHYNSYVKDGFKALSERWEAHSCLKGRYVEVDRLSNNIKGMVEGIDGDGALLIKKSDGKIVRIVSGDVKSLIG